LFQKNADFKVNFYKKQIVEYIFCMPQALTNVINLSKLRITANNSAQLNPSFGRTK
jgi:hypothetical protein